jgi:hypothetical protein
MRLEGGDFEQLGAQTGIAKLIAVSHGLKKANEIWIQGLFERLALGSGTNQVHDRMGACKPHQVPLANPFHQSEVPVSGRLAQRCSKKHAQGAYSMRGGHGPILRE